MTMLHLVLFFYALLGASAALGQAKTVRYVHWNRHSPIFRRENSDHIVNVKEFDQVNLICPVAKAGNGVPERHVIYSVTKEEFESCRITNPNPKIVAVCNQPHKLMYFTITFRSFTPTPGGLEFHPGQDYYFISTASNADLHRRVGGGCSSHNMRMIFKVHSNPRQEEAMQTAAQELLERQRELDAPRLNVIADDEEDNREEKVAMEPSYRVFPALKDDGSLTHDSQNVYYYHPRDVLARRRSNLDESVAERRQRLRRRNKQTSSSSSAPMPLTAGASHAASSAFFTSTLVLLVSCWLGRVHR